MQDERLRIEPRDCPGCQHSDAEDLSLGRSPWNIVKCQNCQFVYLNHLPQQDAFENEFAWNTSYKAEKKRRKRKQPAIQWIDDKTRWRLHMFPRPETREFLNDLASPGPVLDVGCGDGGHAMKLPEGFIPYGVEIAPQLAERADQSFRTRGGACLQGDAATAIASFKDDHFTGVMMNSYLEHEFNPREVLESVHAKLKANAPLIIKVPNFGSLNARLMGQGWCGIRLPDHVNYFTWDSLRAMAEDTSFQVRAPFGTNLPTNDNMWAILYKTEATL